MKRVKKISQLDSGGNFSSFHPIGTDGIFVDMWSSNNLEEELHLGGPSSTSFSTDINTKSMIITEEYRKDNQPDYYIMKTTFESINNETKIVQKLFLKKGSQPEVLKKTKTVLFTSVGGNLEIKEVLS